ncbi:hypothetical protein Q7C36_012878 [Tachysurus vachellii]|uniref:Uncharacterized protein n=1 Tax=Tachysurus vachellii TaxID=175792 RepID=A0AA88MQE2_TACVA|nr:hypothetical protein Q7C36_012878 [Tachysurus vachellii]
MGLYAVYPVILKLIIVMSCTACNTAEYEIHGECCPMCTPVLRVLDCCNNSIHWHFALELETCLPCAVCDDGEDMHTEPLTGYYCIETQGESYRKAKQHSTCVPGQYIYQNGTSLLDTMCKDCSEETYSDGLFMHCKPHTNDAVCSHKPSHLGLIIGILVPSLLVLVILSVLL